MKKRIAVLGVQVPFVRGGAEALNEELVHQINLRGERHNVEAELIQLPFKWYPEEHVLKDMMAWKLVDIEESDGLPIDLVIGTKFPSYCADHPKKVLWLVHQHRLFYDLAGTPYDRPGEDLTDLDRSVRHSVRRGDTLALESCRARYSIGHTVSSRLRRYNKFDADVLHPPPKLRERIHSGEPGDYLLYVGRIETIKRIELLIDALAIDRRSRAIIIGIGKSRAALMERAERLGLGDRCVFPGYVTDEAYLEYLANCRAVYYGPFDEDYGFATVEALAAAKPVITFTDSGEPAYIVEATGCGWLVPLPTAAALAEVTAQVGAATHDTLREIGRRGSQFVASIHWETIFNHLVASQLP